MTYVYKYDEKTKEYLGKAEALLDPLETQLQQKEIYLLPAAAKSLSSTKPFVNGEITKAGSR